MHKGPGGLLFEEREGVFPLVRGYAATFDLDVTKHRLSRGTATMAHSGHLNRQRQKPYAFAWTRNSVAPSQSGRGSVNPEASFSESSFSASVPHFREKAQ